MTQGLYWFGPPLWCNTLLQCVVWWIASWADDDEQYKEEQAREGLLLAGAMNCWEEFSHPSLSLFMIVDLIRSPLYSIVGLDPQPLDAWSPSPLYSIIDAFFPTFSFLWVAGPIYRGPGPLPKY